MMTLTRLGQIKKGSNMNQPKAFRKTYEEDT